MSNEPVVAHEAFVRDLALVQALSRDGLGGSGIGDVEDRCEDRVGRCASRWAQSGSVRRSRSEGCGYNTAENGAFYVGADDGRNQPQLAPGSRKRSIDVVHSRARPGHDQLARHPLRSRGHRPRGCAAANSGRSFRSPAGSSTTPTEIWATQSGVLHEALAKAGIERARHRGHRHHQPARDDRRSGSARPARPIAQRHRLAGPAHRGACATRCAPPATRRLIARKTGLVLDAYFSGTKLKWLLDNVPGARARARTRRARLRHGRFLARLEPDRRRGAHAPTRRTRAARCCSTSTRGEWDDELLALLDVPRAVLPRVVAVVGRLRARDASTASTCRSRASPATSRRRSSARRAITPGLAKNTYGTGCFLLLNTGGKPSRRANNLLTTVAWQRGGEIDYALEGSVFIGGAVVQWLRDGLGIIRARPRVEALAASVPDNGGVYFVPAFAGLGAPHWDAYARGAMFGLTRGATAAHIARAALEAIAFQSADVLTAMQKDAGITLTELRVDGGAAANNLLMQFQADVLGVPGRAAARCSRPRRSAPRISPGSPSATGRRGGRSRANWRVDRRFEPAMSRDRAQELRSPDGTRRSSARRAGRRRRPTAASVPDACVRGKKVHILAIACICAFQRTCALCPPPLRPRQVPGPCHPAPARAAGCAARRARSPSATTTDGAVGACASRSSRCCARSLRAARARIDGPR